MLYCIVIVFFLIDLNDIVKFLINMLDKPFVNDAFLETPYIADFCTGDFFLLGPCVNGLWFQTKVGGDFFQCHDFVIQRNSPLL